MSSVDFNKLDKASHLNSEHVFELVSSKHIAKFNKLCKSPLEETELATEKVIINLTENELDTPTISVLKKGLNFAIAPRKIPTEKIISGVEVAIKDIPEETSEEIRQEVATIIRKSQPPRSNITREEMAALRKIREDENVVVVPADKGNATVIMSTKNYKEKMYTLLDDPTYRKITKNPTRKITEKLKKLVKLSPSLQEENKKNLLISDPVPPVLYGLPKVHKNDIPMRPIVSAINSPTYNAARFISMILSQEVGKTSTHIKDSRHFIDILKQLKLDHTDILVSLDVVSLFTKIPLDETIAIIQTMLPEDLAKIAELCLQSTYFYFDGSFYEQVDGTPMGSPLSPVIANLFMENFERKALDSAQLKPKLFLRFVDDTFIIWPHGRNTLDHFLQYMNSINPQIQFTMEIEEDKKLPFLDVLVIRKPDGSLGHTVYRKKTHTDLYLNAESHHHPLQKATVLNTLANRAFHISDTENIKSENSHLLDVLQRNGYKKHEIYKAIKRQGKEKTSAEQQQEEKKKYAILPYVKGTTEKIGRVLEKYNIKTVYRPPTKIKQILRPIKDKFPLQTSGVYHVKCSCGRCYVGETGRLISTRIKEHIRCTKKFDSEHSAIADHSLETKHAIEFDNVKVLAHSSNYFERKVLEAIEIRKHSQNFNKDSGIELSNTWKPVLSKLNVQCQTEKQQSLHNKEHGEASRSAQTRREPEHSRNDSNSPPTTQQVYNLRARPTRAS